MAVSRGRQRTPGRASEGPLALTLCGGAALWAVLMGGAVIANALAGLPRPPWSPVDPFLALGSPSRPDAVWQRAMAPTWLYWTVTGVVAAATVVSVLLAHRAVGGRDSSSPRLDGCAGAAEIRGAAGSRALIRRAGTLRPSIRKPSVAELGFRLGSSKGVGCYCAVEDSVVVLGPPRSGKGLHLAIPMVLDAPGAVLTTSTRPDSLAVTVRARERVGPVAVFDPQQVVGVEQAGGPSTTSSPRPSPTATRCACSPSRAPIWSPPPSPSGTPPPMPTSHN